jgi:hypothetical protein
MPDHSISFVPKISNYPDHQKKAKEILDWLVFQDIVKAKRTDCVFGIEEGYEVSDGARKFVTEPEHLPFGLALNGLQIAIEKTVFDTGENELQEVICPNCGQNVIAEFVEHIEKWFDNSSNKMSCSECGKAQEMNDYLSDPEWAVSNLGFTFWNWPEFKEEFVAEFKRKLGGNVAVVRTWI